MAKTPTRPAPKPLRARWSHDRGSTVRILAGRIVRFLHVYRVLDWHRNMLAEKAPTPKLCSGSMQRLFAKRSIRISVQRYFRASDGYADQRRGRWWGGAQWVASSGLPWLDGLEALCSKHYGCTTQHGDDAEPCRVANRCVSFASIAPFLLHPFLSPNVYSSHDGSSHIQTRGT